MIEKLKASPLVQQMRQWPPTPTTVIGGGLLSGLASYHMTGSLEVAVFIAGIFKAICPQAGDAADKAVDLLGKLPDALKK